MENNKHTTLLSLKQKNNQFEKSEWSGFSLTLTRKNKNRVGNLKNYSVLENEITFSLFQVVAEGEGGGNWFFLAKSV